MRLLATTIVSFSLLTLGLAHAGQTQVTSDNGTRTVEITRKGSQPSIKRFTQYFTGSVRIDSLFSARLPSRTAGASVTFEPGARTAWHTHPWDRP